MKWPTSLVALVDYGIVDEVLRPLMSGKEAQVYLVRCGAEERVAKVYKEAEGRSFRQRADYTEGRRTRNSRDQRAVEKRTRHGKAQDEAAWRVAEVDRIRRLREAGVRVPEPYEFVDGVLVMELVKDTDGQPAPRLGDLSFGADEAGEIYDLLIRETVKMLAADIVHGDLSEFNVLMGSDGPVIIDFPQAVDPTSNRNARTLLLRDVQNLHRFLSRFVPERKVRRLGEEMWKLYEQGKLKPNTVMRGTYKVASGPTDTGAVMALIEDAKRDALRESGRGERERVDDSELEGASEYTVTGSGEPGSAKAKGPILKRVVEFTPARAKPTGGGGRTRAGEGSDRKRSGERGDRQGSGGRGDRANRGRGNRSREPAEGQAAQGRASSDISGGRGQRSRSSNDARENRDGAGPGRSRGRRRSTRESNERQQTRGDRDGQRGRAGDGGGTVRREDAAGRSGGQRRETNEARVGRGADAASSARSAADAGETTGRRRRRRRGRGSGSGQGSASAASDRDRNPKSSRPNSHEEPKARSEDPGRSADSGGARKRSRRRRRRPSAGGSNDPK